MEISAAPQCTNPYTGKVRILLQTITHLVPGENRSEKLPFIENMISRHHWNRDFDRNQERMYSYHDDFGLDNIKCFFLIDHHGHDHDSVEEQTPLVLWYRWTGQSLIRINEELPSKIQKKLKKWPFTWEGRKFHRAPGLRGPDGKYTPLARRELIQDQLRLGVPIFEDGRVFLREYPDHAEWLRTHLVHELWKKIEPFCDLPNGTDK